MKYKSLVAALLTIFLVYSAVFAQSTAIGTPTPLPKPSVPKADIAVFTGTGNKKIDVRKFREPSLVRIWGYSEKSIFGVTDDGFNIDLIFGSTPYYGEYLLNYLIDKSSASLNVTAQGDWRIEILPLTTAHSLKVPGIFKGEGDSVVLIQSESLNSLRIQSDGTSGVKVYGYGNEKTLMLETWVAIDATVNTNEPICFCQTETASNDHKKARQFDD